MIDLHSHVLPFVDDGSASVEQSVYLLNEAKKNGVTEMALTPHYRRGTCTISNEKIRADFEQFKNMSEVVQTGVKLWLGREIETHRSMISDFEKGDVIPLGNGKCVLIELKYSVPVDLDELVYNVELSGYTPVLAHVERFSYTRNVKVIKQLKNAGAIIQVNAQSVVDKSRGDEYSFAKKLVRKKFVDVIAGDVHYGRKNFMREAYLKVSKKNPDYAELIFKINPERILNGNY